MRRILLLFALAAGVAVVAVPSAGALTFPDDICPVRAGTVIKVCPSGETGKPYTYQLKGRDGTGCVPYVKFSLLNSAVPPGLSLTSDGLISGTPTTPGVYGFWIKMQDDKGAVSWCNDDAATEREFEITIVQGLQINQRESHLPPAQIGLHHRRPVQVLDAEKATGAQVGLQYRHASRFDALGQGAGADDGRGHRRGRGEHEHAGEQHSLDHRCLLASTCTTRATASAHRQEECHTQHPRPARFPMPASGDSPSPMPRPRGAAPDAACGTIGPHAFPERDVRCLARA